jgi:hypothetical protein
MEVKMDGRTYVWLDEPFITGEINGVPYGIQGLAIKTKSFSTGQDPMDWESGTDAYLGANEIPISALYDMAEALTDEDMAELRKNTVHHLITRKLRESRNGYI